MGQETHVAIKVWDLPVRIFHWAIVALLAFQVATGLAGGRWMAWHVYGGYAMLVLVVFRILWGFAGSTHARFASFIAGPAATLRFAKRLFSRQAVPQVGHNPLGGWSVVAMLVVLGMQGGSGLFAYDGLATEGPLAMWVSFEVSNLMSQFHRTNSKVVLVLSGLHVAAVLFHWLFKREDLIGAMFTGVKRVPGAMLRERREALRGTPLRRLASRENAAAYVASSWKALVLLGVAAGVVYAIIQLPQ